jgi:hypothetical protein
MVKTSVMPPAQPAHQQRFIVLVVMRIDSFDATDFAAELFQISGNNSTLKGKVSVVLYRICSPPICLPCLADNHDFSYRCWSRRVDVFSEADKNEWLPANWST